MFKDQPENVVTFTKFVQSAFNLFIQENLLNKEVIDAVKNLNNITVDMKIFAADGRDVLQKLDIRTLEELQEGLPYEQTNYKTPNEIHNSESDSVTSVSDDNKSIMIKEVKRQIRRIINYM
ncbi:11520_t:CDS:2 [Funneliformis caledonium]|uniref:11520_t:CDS:1 n=1 Tax=Funneliformis caledonium TaxID=1117310 RepID=A0A9N9HJJ6_9GLOM|nr:11520_t:CDS:2 [Funneliformis caledonium]